jgi:hypothetical protein
MEDQPPVTTTRVDDIPLIIGLLRQMRIAEVYDQTIGDHAAHTGLSGGCITRDVNASEFEDTRLGRHLKRLSDGRRWATLGDVGRRWAVFEAAFEAAVEAALFVSNVQVYEMVEVNEAGLPSVMLDSTTARRRMDITRRTKAG